MGIIKQEGIFGSKNKAGNSIEYDRIYYKIMYLEKIWSNLERWASNLGRLFSTNRTMLQYFLNSIIQYK